MGVGVGMWLGDFGGASLVCVVNGFCPDLEKLLLRIVFVYRMSVPGVPKWCSEILSKWLFGLTVFWSLLLLVM